MVLTNSYSGRTLVLFDMGGVLLELSYDRFYKESASLSQLSPTLSPEQFKEKYIQSGIEAELHAGRITTRDMQREVERIIGRKLVPERFADLMSKRYVGQIDETVRLKKKISGMGYHAGIFSNTTALDKETVSSRFPEMLQTYDLMAPSVFSYEVGATKSETRMEGQTEKRPMYEAVKNIGYAKIILIDDNPQYIDIAVQEFGWHGILFTQYADSSEAIKAAGQDTTAPMQATHERRRTAGSIDELVSSLAAFGIRIRQ